jgi:hypothetical protein
MSKISNKLYKLARLIQCISEISTDKGVLVIDSDLAVGVEAFVTDAETGDLVLAPAGEYIADGKTITINQQGVIEAITENTEQEPIEDNPTEPEQEPQPEPEQEPEQEPEPQQEPEQEPQPEQEPEPQTEPEQEPAEDVDALKAQIEDLTKQLEEKDAKIAELQAQIDEYKAKEQATPPTIEEEDQRDKTVKMRTSRAERIYNALTK